MFSCILFSCHFKPILFLALVSSVCRKAFMFQSLGTIGEVFLAIKQPDNNWWESRDVNQSAANYQ